MLHNLAKKTFSLPEHPPNLLMLCCVDKCLIGWHSLKTISEMRERCGGQGFLAANTFGEAIAGGHAANTAEGDNRVLMIKVVKDMLTIWKADPEVFYNGPDVKITNI